LQVCDGMIFRRGVDAPAEPAKNASVLGMSLTTILI